MKLTWCGVVIVPCDTPCLSALGLPVREGGRRREGGREVRGGREEGWKGDEGREGRGREGGRGGREREKEGGGREGGREGEGGERRMTYANCALVTSHTPTLHDLKHVSIILHRWASGDGWTGIDVIGLGCVTTKVF